MMGANKQIKINRLVKHICWALEVAFFVVFVSLCIAVGVKNRHIKEYKAEIAKQELVIESLTKNDTIK